PSWSLIFLSARLQSEWVLVEIFVSEWALLWQFDLPLAPWAFHRLFALPTRQVHGTASSLVQLLHDIPLVIDHLAVLQCRWAVVKFLVIHRWEGSE
ncbi:hypothetical protein PFISCL1PPCAC_23517, partial [Pristionchus fissidentatus]